MQHRINLTTHELIVIREAIHLITIKGIDAPIVGGLLDKVYKGIEKAALEEQNIKQSPITSHESTDVQDVIEK